MKENIGLVSYAIGSIFFLLLSVIILVKWRGGKEATLLVIATFSTAIWAAGLAIASSFEVSSLLIVTLEISKYTVWSLFLLSLLRKNNTELSRYFSLFIALVCLVVLVGAILASGPVYGFSIEITKFLILSSLGFSLLGLVLVEQLYRNTPDNNKWAIKFLCVGVGGLFVYDIYLYSSGLLFQLIDQVLWNARGIITALIMPLIAIAAVRNPDWSFKPFVSRHFIFYTTSLFAVGVYMLLMAVSGYYVRTYGGNWGAFLQTIFSFGAVLILFVVVMSGQARARLKQFINEHFYSNKYDYREEWLRLTRILSTSADELPIYQRVLKGIAQIVESPAGSLWLREANNVYSNVTSWNMRISDKKIAASKSDLIRFLETNQSVIDVNQYRKNSGSYENLVLPEWVISIPKIWLIVPILHDEMLYGYVVLSESRGSLHHTWEDNELLLTVGRQVASYLAQYEAANRLAEAQQFEAFNRLSAFIVHDLKNVIAQLSLIVTNAKNHQGNPIFMQDAISTVDNAVIKMNRMLDQLKQGRLESKNKKRVCVTDVLDAVIKKRAAFTPMPELRVNTKGMYVFADEDNLTSIIEHLIQNAQEATEPTGRVIVKGEKQEQWVAIEIQDSGCGMNADFVQNRLFKPFDTTKGNAGMGMGAYESREIVKQLGGDLSVKSIPDEGTIVNIRLPLSEK